MGGSPLYHVYGSCGCCWQRGHPEMLSDVRWQEGALGRRCQEMQVVAREGIGNLKWSHGSTPGGAREKGEKGIFILSIITIWVVGIVSLIWLVRKSQRRQNIKLPRVTPSIVIYIYKKNNFPKMFLVEIFLKSKNTWLFHFKEREKKIAIFHHDTSYIGNRKGA